MKKHKIKLRMNQWRLVSGAEILINQDIFTSNATRRPDRSLDRSMLIE